MKRILWLVPVFLFSLALSGCGSLRAEAGEIEQLRVIQVMGLDTAPGGAVRVTLASVETAASPRKPICLSATGPSISAAIGRIRELSLEEDLFCGHIQCLLVGQEAAQAGLGPFLAYVCRSPDLRLDTPLYIVRDGTAEDLMTQAGKEDLSVSSLLQTVEAKIARQAGGTELTAGKIAGDLARQDAALACALTLRAASEDDPVLTAAYGGLAVFQQGSLRGFLEPENSLGAWLLLGGAGPQELVVRGRTGETATLELTDGSCQLLPVWEEGQLKGLQIFASVGASVLETGDGSAVDSAYADLLTSQLEAAVSEKLGAVLQISRQLPADFLGLGTRVEQASPRAWREMGLGFSSQLPELEISIAVRGQLRHTNDSK